MSCNKSQLTEIYYDLMVLVYSDILFAIITMHKCQWSDCSNRVQFKLHRSFNASFRLVTLLEIRFRSLFYDAQKRTQNSEVTTTGFRSTFSVAVALFKRNAGVGPSPKIEKKLNFWYNIYQTTKSYNKQLQVINFQFLFSVKNIFSGGKCSFLKNPFFS